MLNKTLPWLIALMLLSGCQDWFKGEEDQLYFRSTLSRPYLPWTPKTPVVIGSTVKVTAFEHAAQGLFDSDVPSQAEAQLDGGSVARVASAPGSFTGEVVAEGPTRLDWEADGGQSDAFAIHGQQAASLHLVDPLRLRERLISSVPTVERIDPPLPEDFETDVYIAGGEPFFLEWEVRGADGGTLAHSPEVVQVAFDGGAPATTAGFGVHFEVPAGADGPLGSISASIDGGAPWSRNVIAGSADQVAEVELRQHRLAGSRVIVASARLDGGALLWQPPVEWTAEPPLELRSPSEYALLDLELHRRDVMIVVGVNDEADAGVELKRVHARVGAITAELTLPVLIRPPPEAPPPAPAPQGCGCTGGGGSAAVLAVLAVGLVTLRVRRRRSAPAMPRTGR